MKYINPYDISDYFGKISLENFKRFKKRVLNELELEDNEIEIKNQKFSKNEIYTILNKIDENRELLKIYFKIYMKLDINDFLYGLKDNFSIVAQIQFLDEESRNFVAPYLVDKLKIIYKNAFLNNDINFLTTPMPISKIYLDEIYEPVYKILKNKENELKNKKGNKVDFYEIKKIVGDVDLLNSLPDYFEKNRNDIALSVRDLAIDAYNEYDDIKLSQKLLDFALSLEVNSKNKDMFLKDKKDLEELKEKEKGNKLLKEIENILNSYENFAIKLRKIENYLTNNFLDDNVLKIIFGMIFKYIENNKINLLVTDNLNALEKILLSIKNNLNDYQFREVINSNLNEIKKIRNKINKEKGNPILGYLLLGSILLGFVNPGFWILTFILWIIIGIFG